MCDLTNLKYKLIVIGAFMALFVAVAGVTWELNIKTHRTPTNKSDEKTTAVLSKELSKEKAQESLETSGSDMENENASEDEDVVDDLDDEGDDEGSIPENNDEIDYSE